MVAVADGVGMVALVHPVLVALQQTLGLVLLAATLSTLSLLVVAKCLVAVGIQTLLVRVVDVLQSNVAALIS